MSHEPRVLPVGEELPPLEGKGEARQGRKGKGARTAPGRFEVINSFADFTLAGLDRSEIAVWLLLWRDTKKDGTARTSQADLGRRAGVSVRTVGRAIKRLQGAGLLTVVRRGSLLGGPSLYRVHGLGREAG